MASHEVVTYLLNILMKIRVWFRFSLPSWKTLTNRPLDNHAKWAMSALCFYVYGLSIQTNRSTDCPLCELKFRFTHSMASHMTSVHLIDEKCHTSLCVARHDSFILKIEVRTKLMKFRYGANLPIKTQALNRHQALITQCPPEDTPKSYTILDQKSETMQIMKLGKILMK